MKHSVNVQPTKNFIVTHEQPTRGPVCEPCSESCATRFSKIQLFSNSLTGWKRTVWSWYQSSALTSLVPNQMSLMWSQMALAADMALDSFLALMTAAPRCCTVYRTHINRTMLKTLSFKLKPRWKEQNTHWDEFPPEPRLVLDGVVGRHLGAVDVDLGMVDVRVLGGGVVPPDDDVLHVVGRDAATHRHLQVRDGNSRSNITTLTCSLSYNSSD